MILHIMIIFFALITISSLNLSKSKANILALSLIICFKKTKSLYIGDIYYVNTGIKILIATLIFDLDFRYPKS